MRTIWHSLAWKEWNEHKWKLVAIMAIIGGVILYPLIKLDHGTLPGIVFGLIMGMAPLAVFVGVASAASERSRGTLRFLQALPVSMWRVALHKLAFGLATAILPAVLTLLLVLGWVSIAQSLGLASEAIKGYDLQGEGMPFQITNSWITSGLIMVTLVAASFYIWTAALGVNRKDEVSAGAVALIAIIGWIAILAFGWERASSNHGHEQFSAWPVADQYLAILVTGTAPGGIVTIVESARNFRNLFLSGLLVFGLTHLILAATYVFRFARPVNLEVRSHRVSPADNGWLGKPRQSEFTALAWKQARESGPIAAAGLAMIIGLAASTVAANDPQHRDKLADIYAVVAVMMGMAIAIVIGIGAFLNDVRPGINTFWRSRPINPDMAFWTKFGCGLAILLASIYAPILFLAWRGGRIYSLESGTYFYPVIHVTLFAAAVAMTCLVRNAVYAAILSIAATFLGCALIYIARWLGEQVGLFEPRSLLALEMNN
jgi:ABC-type transport system involved in multi-copper enzyme maturation permease subunit